MYRSTPVKVPKDGYSESVLDTWGNLYLAVAPHHAHARVAVSNRDPTSLGADNTCLCTSSQTGQQSQKMTYVRVDYKARHPEMRSFQGWGYWNIGYWNTVLIRPNTERPMPRPTHKTLGLSSHLATRPDDLGSAKSALGHEQHESRTALQADKHGAC